jgi:glycosyltransferase involved in cell wall biosynthesis
LFHHGLRRVDVIICQSRHQQSLLAQHHRLNGVALPNLFPDRHASPIQDPHHRPKPVVWVSVIKRTKRPQLALQTAKSLPQFQFIMVGGRALIDPDLYDRVEKEARAIANVRFLGFRPFEQTESLIGGAQVFLNTSEWEGFPNTFLQAWRAGVPTVSFHDPDRVIEEHGLGRAVKDLEEMRAAIVELYQGERRAACSQRARMYFDQHHRLESVIKKYDELFQTLAEGRPYSAGSPVFAH